MTRGYAASIEIKKCGNPEAVALVLLSMEALDLPLPERLPEADLELRRFSSDGAVVVRGTTASVFIGGTLIGVFETDRGQPRRHRLSHATVGRVYQELTLRPLRKSMRVAA